MKQSGSIISDPHTKRTRTLKKGPQILDGERKHERTEHGRKEQCENSPEDYRCLRGPAGRTHSNEQKLSHPQEMANTNKRNLIYQEQRQYLNFITISYCDTYFQHADMNVP